MARAGARGLRRRRLPGRCRGDLPRRGRGASPSSRPRSQLAGGERIDEADVLGLVDRAPLTRVVAAFEAAPELALARPLDRLVHPQHELVAPRGDDRVVQREIPHLELLGAARPRRLRSRQRRISSKSRLVAQATTSGSTCGSSRRRAAITSAGLMSSAWRRRARRRRLAAAPARAGTSRVRPRARPALGLEDRERVAHHRPRHAELGGERALGRQPPAGLAPTCPRSDDRIRLGELMLRRRGRRVVEARGGRRSSLPTNPTNSPGRRPPRCAERPHVAVLTHDALQAVWLQPIRQIQPYDGRLARCASGYRVAREPPPGRRPEEEPAVRLATIVTATARACTCAAPAAMSTWPTATGDPRLATLAARPRGRPRGARPRSRGRPTRTGREVAESEFGPAVPSPEPDPLPRRELPRARARGRAAADDVARDLRARRRLGRRPLR